MDRLATICLAVAIALAMTSTAGADAISSSTAVFDWSTFDFSYSSGILDSVQYGSFSWAEVEDKDTSKVYYDDSQFAWEDTSAQASIPNALAKAWTTFTEVGEKVNADTTGQGLFWAQSAAQAGRWVEFVTVGAGTLTVSVDYSLEQTLDTQVFGDMAFGNADVSLYVHNFTKHVSASYWDEILWEVVDGDSFYDYKSGTLTGSMYFADDNYGRLDASVSNSARVESVSAPAAFLLGILGLGVAGIKLRKFA
jgi:hypothetical protein